MVQSSRLFPFIQNPLSVQSAMCYSPHWLNLVYIAFTSCDRNSAFLYKWKLPTQGQLLQEADRLLINLGSCYTAPTMVVSANAPRHVICLFHPLVPRSPSAKLRSTEHHCPTGLWNRITAWQHLAGLYVTITLSCIYSYGFLSLVEKILNMGTTVTC